MVAQTARKQARPAPEPEREDDSDFDGVLELGTADDSPKYDVLFRLDGTEYDVLTNPPASLMLGYFDKVRKEGPNVAFSWVLERMLGADGYEAVTTSPKVSKNDFRQVGEAVLTILLGTQGETAPKSPRKGQRSRSG